MRHLTAITALLAGLALFVVGDARTPYAYGRDYPAGDGMVAVIAGRPLPEEMPRLVNGAYSRYHRMVELHPEEFTGIYPTRTGHGCSAGMALVVGLVRARQAEVRARIARNNPPTTCAQRVWLVPSDLSPAASLFSIMNDQPTRFGAVAAGVDWANHRVVFDVLQVTDELRAEAYRLYGDQVAFELAREAPRAV